MTKIRNIKRFWATIYLARLVKCNFQVDQFSFRFQGQESHFAEKKLSKLVNFLTLSLAVFLRI